MFGKLVRGSRDQTSAKENMSSPMNPREYTPLDGRGVFLGGWKGQV